MTIIAFDVDNTLIKKSRNGEDVPNYGVILLLEMFRGLGYEVKVWSGSGVDYATRWCEKLGIINDVHVIAKGSIEVDIAVDDEDVTLGKVNLKV